MLPMPVRSLRLLEQSRAKRKENETWGTLWEQGFRNSAKKRNGVLAQGPGLP